MMMGVGPERSEVPTGNDDEQRQEEPWVDDVCSEAFLLRATGEEDLASVRSLALTVDTNVSKVNHLGIFLPRLEELRFRHGSTLASFRDFGSSLSGLRVLWVSACGIRHLDGVGALTALEELYLAFNDVEDLTMIAMHDKLEVLDLESNSVRDFDQVDQLGTCPRLSCLTLSENPVCRAKDYWKLTLEAVPHLSILDEQNISGLDRDPPSPPSYSHRLDHHPKGLYEAQALSPLPGHLGLQSGAKLPPLLSMDDRSHSSGSDDIGSEAASDTASTGSSCGVTRVTGRVVLLAESYQGGDFLDEIGDRLDINRIACHPSTSARPKLRGFPQGALHRRLCETHGTSYESLLFDENERGNQDTTVSPRSEGEGDLLGGVGFLRRYARGLRNGSPYNPSTGGCIPEARPSTAWTSGARLLLPGDHVDEEELVTEAIKRLRFLPSGRKRSSSVESSAPSDVTSASSKGDFMEDLVQRCGWSSSQASKASGDADPPRQERTWEWEDNLEVLKVLGLDDIAGPAGRAERRSSAFAALNAASDLTHGSEVHLRGRNAGYFKLVGLHAKTGMVLLNPACVGMRVAYCQGRDTA